jgi:excisionase family DNA binding protein
LLLDFVNERRFGTLAPPGSTLKPPEAGGDQAYGQPKEQRGLLRVTQVALVLGIGRTKVLALLAAGALAVVQLGRSVRIPRDALERWVRKRTEGDNKRLPGLH